MASSIQQIFANTKSHTIRTGTANTPPMHQTALSYEAAVPNGGRLAPKNAPREREKSVLFAAQESPDDLSDSGGGIQKRPDSGMTRSMIRDWSDFVRLGGTKCSRFRSPYFSLSTELMAKNSRAVRSKVDAMGRGCILLSLIFYKICTKIIHNRYVGLYSRVCVHGVQRTSP